MTDLETAMLTFLQEAQNEFNSEKEVDYFIQKHAPKLMEAARKQLMAEIWHKESEHPDNRHPYPVINPDGEMAYAYYEKLCGWQFDRDFKHSTNMLWLDIEKILPKKDLKSCDTRLYGIVKKVIDGLLSTNTDISKSDCVVYHIPTGVSYTVQEAAEMVCVAASKSMEVLNHVYSDTEQTILVRVFGKEMVFTRTREDKNSEWHEWQKITDI